MEISGPPSPAKRIGNLTFYASAAGLVFVTYLLVFLLVGRDGGLAGAAVASLTNLLPLIPLAAAAQSLIRRYLMTAHIGRQVVGHGIFAIVFALAWHWLLLLLIGIREGQSATQFSVEAFFSGPSLAWQMLQGLTVYALIAALTYLRARPQAPDPTELIAANGDDADPSMKRFFTRQGDDIRPIDVSEIVHIAGADDYAEVTTMEGQHLVKTTLAKFEEALNAEQFLRIHRSRIVNLHRIKSAEPTGDGRILLHMENDEKLTTSRSGAKELRQRVI